MIRTPQEIQQMQDGVAGELLELRRRVKELEQIHQLDMAEIAYQRRQIDFLMEANREP